MTSLTTFSQFSTLPSELQLLIWSWAFQMGDITDGTAIATETADMCENTDCLKQSVDVSAAALEFDILGRKLAGRDSLELIHEEARWFSARDDAFFYSYDLVRAFGSVSMFYSWDYLAFGQESRMRPGHLSCICLWRKGPLSPWLPLLYTCRMSRIVALERIGEVFDRGLIGWPASSNDVTQMYELDDLVDDFRDVLSAEPATCVLSFDIGHATWRVMLFRNVLESMKRGNNAATTPGQSSSAIVQMTPTTFPQFAMLPQELQLQIWSWAFWDCPESHSLDTDVDISDWITEPDGDYYYLEHICKTAQRPFHYSSDSYLIFGEESRMRAGQISRISVLPDSGWSSLLHTCRLSCIVLLEQIKHVFERQFDGWPEFGNVIVDVPRKYDFTDILLAKPVPCVHTFDLQETLEPWQVTPCRVVLFRNLLEFMKRRDNESS